jgi:hypothetical protein
MKIKVNMSRALLESITKEVISEAKLKTGIRKKAVHKKELKEIEMINESPTTEFINAVKDLDPAALTALGVSALPIGAAIKVIMDFIKDKRPMKDKLQDYGSKVARNR